jgi:uncharacterized membrane protein YfcA
LFTVEYLVVCIAALIASGLTFFSGFGLGTLMLPTFALFFPLPTAIAMTAVVHLLNNVFKLLLIGEHADKDTVIRFGAPAVLTAFVGAVLLVRLSGLEPWYVYEIAGRTCEVTPIRLVIAVLMAVFAVVEVGPASRKLRFDRKFLPVGGLMSGFFGGLSGHQGALRSAFLIKCGLSKESFIASGVAIACVVDVVRLGVYGANYDFLSLGGRLPIVGAAVLAAFAGAFIGRRILHKVSMKIVQWIVAVMLLAVAVGLGTGFI